MTTSPTTQPAATTEPAAGAKPDANAELRAHAKNMETQNKALKAQVLGTHLEALGLKVDEGLGKAVFSGYEGEFTQDAVATYLQAEYSYAKPEGQASTQDTTAATAQAAQQSKVESVLNQSAPVTPTTRLDQIAKLDAALAEPGATRADAQAAMSTKLEEYVENRGSISVNPS